MEVLCLVKIITVDTPGNKTAFTSLLVCQKVMMIVFTFHSFLYLF